jgi:hypothetical protein
MRRPGRHRPGSSGRHASESMVAFSGMRSKGYPRALDLPTPRESGQVMHRLADEYRAWERLCRAEAARADSDFAREDLLQSAEHCRCAAQGERLLPVSLPRTVYRSAQDVVKYMILLGERAGDRTQDPVIKSYIFCVHGNPCKHWIFAITLGNACAAGLFHIFGEYPRNTLH